MNKRLKQFLNSWPGIGALTSALMLAACSEPTVTLGRPCDTDADCNAGEVCQLNICKLDEGSSVPDASTPIDGDASEEEPPVPAHDAGIPERPPAAASGQENAVTDSDCDGLSDEEEFSIIYGFDAEGNPLKTDPNNRDTDGDGLLDGIERGRTTSPDPICGCVNGSTDGYCGCSKEEYDARTNPECARYFYGATEPANPTSPVLADTDGDGIPDGVEDANQNGHRGAGETNPASTDSDGDGLSDYDEINTHGTHPAKADTDGDGLPDGLEIANGLDPNNPDTDGDACLDGDEDRNRNGKLDDGESDPRDPSDCGTGLADDDQDGLSNEEEAILGTNPNNADSDGDGLSDYDEVRIHGTDPMNPDTDGDGLSDSFEVNTSQTDPLKRDSDDDGISDKAEYEGGLNPNNPDTDGDGYMDGVEASEGENYAIVINPPFNPTQSQDLATTNPAAQNACATESLRKVEIHKVSFGDIEIAATAEFSETTKLKNAAGRDIGVMIYNPTAQVIGIALSKTPNGTNASQEEIAAKGALEQLGTVSGATSQNFTTWDGFEASHAYYDLANTRDLKELANNLAGKFASGASGLWDTTSPAGIGGPFKIEAAYVRRSASRTIAVFAIMPTAKYDANESFELADLGGGSAQAQFGDTTSAKCEIFETDETPKIDFVWVVDCTGSMDDYQEAVGNAGSSFLAQLENANIDWRMAGICANPNRVTNAWSSSQKEGFRDFTTNATTIRGWFSGGTQAYHTSGGGERMVQTAHALIEKRFKSSSFTGAQTIRADAALVFLLLGDADDQYASPSVSEITISELETYFDTYRGTAGASKLQMHAIYCQEGLGADGISGSTSACGESQKSPHRVASIVKHLGGVEGNIHEVKQYGTTALTPIITNIMSAATAGTSTYETERAPIAATIKMAIDPSTSTYGANCDLNDVPRSKSNGFDYDGTTQRILFYGDCRPTEAGKQIAISYRYWNDITSNPDGVDENCEAPLEWSVEQNQCVCPDDCGGNDPNPDDPIITPQSLMTRATGKPYYCDAKTCEWTCSADCGGCPTNNTCDTTTCTCSCEQTITCNPGYVFDQEACGCECDVAALEANVPTGYQIDEEICGYTCAPDCGGCPTGFSCNTSLCICSGGFN